MADLKFSIICFWYFRDWWKNAWWDSSIVKCWATSLPLDTSMQSSLPSKGICWRRELVRAWSCGPYNVLKLWVLKFLRIYNSCQNTTYLKCSSTFLVLFHGLLLFEIIQMLSLWGALCVLAAQKAGEIEFILSHQ